MPKSPIRRSSSPSQSRRSSVTLSRRQLLAGAGAGAAALLLGKNGVQAEARQGQAPAGRAVVFTHTTVANADSVQDDVALAVQGNTIAAIGPTDDILKKYPNAEVYDGRGKALFPGLANCHAHMAAVIARGFNEDFGFPNNYRLAVSPNSLLSAEENTLMVTVAALEAIRTGTTTMVQNTGGIAPYAAALAKSGLRCVFAESARDAENVSGATSAESLAKGATPTFSPKLREEGLQRINDLFSAWHGKNEGRITVFPAAGLAESSSPELLQAVRAFAEKHDLGYTIHLSQSRYEVDFMKKHYGLRPPAFLDKHGFLGPRLFAGHCRYVDDSDIALLGKTRTIISHQAGMASNRGVIPPIAKLRAAGCPIALGTDNNTNDVFEVMRIALLTERISRDDPHPGGRPQPEDILADAAHGGAIATRQEKTNGILEAGRKADILVINTLRAHLVPYGRIVSAVIHSGHPDDIESVMIDGQFVMRNHKVLTMDEASIIKEADAVGRRVWAKVQAASPVKVPREPRPR